MTTPQQVRRKFRGLLKTKVDKQNYTAGIIGDGAGVVDAGGGRVYVRTSGDYPIIAICDGVKPQDNLPVWVGRPLHDPKNMHVMGIRKMGSTDTTEGGVSAHHKQHEWFGDDEMHIQRQQIMQLRAIPISSDDTLQRLRVFVYPAIIDVAGTATLVGTQNANGTISPLVADLSPYVISTAGKAKWVRIDLNTSGALVLTAGTEVDLSALTLADIPAAPAAFQQGIAAIRMRYNQDRIVEHRTNNDIVDLRDQHAHGASGVTLAIDGLTDVVITSVGDGETLIYDVATGKWINKTLAEAGIAAANHTHTESDITDLDHDAVKLGGITVDTTGIADGQAMVYDQANAKFIAGDAGSSLTVEEADGTPSVSGVSTIKVTNGTLTDNTGGTVTLDFGSAATDGSAIHDNEAGEIHAITEKTTPADNDELVIEDSADSYSKKRVKVSNLPAGTSTGGADILEVQVFM